MILTGHFACGTIAGENGNAGLCKLTRLLARFESAINTTGCSDDRTPNNCVFVDPVARTHAQQTVKPVRERRPCSQR